MIAARHPAVLAAVVTGAVVAGALVQLGAALGVGLAADYHLRAERENDAGRVVAAVARGDCTTVAAAYRAATTGLVFPRRRPPISDKVTRAATDCRDLARVDALAASGRRAEALAGYLRFRSDHRLSLLYRHVPDRLGAVLRAGRPTPDTETCGLLAELVARDDRPAPKDAMPDLLASCGELLAAASREAADREWNWATVLLRAVRQGYRDSPEASRVEATEAALLVRVREGPAIRSIRPPLRVDGSAAGRGRVQIVYKNHTRGTMTFAISGRVGGRVIEVPACDTCPELGGDADCTEQGDMAVVTLPAGTYRVWISIDFSGQSDEWVKTWRLKTGAYADCIATWKS